jgi:tetratricopeptide (TPR) repeat protein
MDWYRQAMRLEPELGDPWYYVGLLYEDQGQWLQALDAYDRAYALGHLRQVYHSSPHYRVGMIYQWRLDPRQLESALEAYQAAVQENHFQAEWEAADCHFKLGEILRWQRHDPDEYMAKFQRAVELNPSHLWARILLGLAIYERDKDLAAAKAELLRAVELAPRKKDAYYHLGEIYRQENRVREARGMYEKALEIDPGFEAARERLAALDEGP